MNELSDASLKIMFEHFDHQKMKIFKNICRKWALFYIKNNQIFYEPAARNTAFVQEFLKSDENKINTMICMFSRQWDRMYHYCNNLSFEYLKQNLCIQNNYVVYHKSHLFYQLVTKDAQTSVVTYPNASEVFIIPEDVYYLIITNHFKKIALMIGYNGCIIDSLWECLLLFKREQPSTRKISYESDMLDNLAEMYKKQRAPKKSGWFF